jgi:hypothetical protein
MTVPLGRKSRIWSITAGLAIGLSFASGCRQEEEAPTSAPPSPLPTADSSRPVQLPPDKSDQGGETKGTSSFKRDLSKDLASPVVEPGGPTTFFPPAGKPDPVTPADGTKSGQP